MDYKAIPGSISGFTQINVGGTGTLADALPAAPLSISEMVARMHRLRQDLNPVHLQALLEKIETHILSDSDIHGITPANVGDAVAQNLIDELFPGTVPASLPTLSVMAITAAFDDALTVTRSGTMMVTDATGMLRAVGPDTMAIDYGIDGLPTIPLFPKRTNSFIRSDAVTAYQYVPDDNTPSIRLSGTGTLAQTAVAGLAPDGTDRVIVCTDDATIDTHGIKLVSIQPNASTTVTDVTSVFVIPMAANYLTVQLVDDSATLDLSTYSAVIDLTTGEVTAPGGGFEAVYVHKSPSGWLRIGAQYAIAGSNTISMTLSGHDASGTPAYSGAGDALFGVFGISTTHGSGLSPFIPTSGVASVVGPTTIAVSGASAIQSAAGMLAIEWLAYRNTNRSVGDERGTALVSIDGAPTLSLLSLAVQAQIGGVSTASVIYGNDTYVTQAVSYGSSGIKFKSTGTVTKTAPGPIAALSGPKDIVIGPVPGYLKSFSVYPVSDDGDAVNYLTSENG